MTRLNKITPCLWFDTQAEEAANFYVGVFDDARVLNVTRYGPGAPRPADMVLTIDFEIQGQQITALNGGPEFTFSEAFSLQVTCDDQEESDRYWYALQADGGQEGQCGWLKDRYGFSWQVFPHELNDLLTDPDPGRAQRAMQAMLKMRRIDLAEVRRAADGG
ncbi:VOC family protein [Nocardiopsis lambiniae]|uniref:VOC family protein n=1 Tax=Nocardiopsis lambiniae TaxID=3075539 RepID=A0ABU2MH30_9ACTN|nr:VOC family protein [Nocardiopsis sp. DSM 44743]MDT0331556.1 VOC family protein [Nocardiopsis sp. DSM 44743]